MAHKSDKEQRLLSASKAFDQGLARHHLSDWTHILDPHVILHKDAITLYDDLHGIGAVKGYFQAYIDRYNFEHHVIAGAVDEPSNVAFSLHQDKNVKPKQTAASGQHAKTEAKASDTIGIFHLRFNERELVQEIYFLRQLSHDEAARKMQKIPDLEKLDIKDITSYGGAKEHGEDRAKKHDKAASLYNHIWATGDVSHADNIMAKDVKMHSLIEGNSMSGVDTFKNMVKGIFKEYEVKDNKSTVAVTAGDKAFIFWRVTGVYKGDWSQVYGISFLVFNTDDKIEEVLTLMQPFPAQRKGLLKREE